MRNKKGISTMIEYVMLIVIAISLTSVIYLWLKGYVPSNDDVECKDGTSIYVSKATCEMVNGRYIIDLEIRNAGRYQLRGFYIRGSENENEVIPSIDLSGDLMGSSPREKEVLFNSVNSNGLNNVFSPSNISNTKFSSGKKIEKIEITPTRVENINDKLVLAVCKNAIVTEYIYC